MNHENVIETYVEYSKHMWCVGDVMTQPNIFFKVKINLPSMWQTNMAPASFLIKIGQTNLVILLTYKPVDWWIRFLTKCYVVRFFKNCSKLLSEQTALLKFTKRG